MKSAIRHFRSAALVVALFAGAVAVAALSQIQLTATITNGLLSISTAALPKGWFPNGDTTKTTLATTWSMGPEACSPALMGGTLSSLSTAPTPQTGTNGQISGYTWSGSVDLTGSENHWWNHYLCDGTVVVEGCNQPISISVTTTAYNQNGNCKTYTDNSGQTVCESDTEVAYLPAIQDPDVFDLCDDSCGIGEWVRYCSANCPGPSKAACMKQCICDARQWIPSECSQYFECFNN